MDPSLALISSRNLSDRGQPLQRRESKPRTQPCHTTAVYVPSLTSSLASPNSMSDVRNAYPTPHPKKTSLDDYFWECHACRPFQSSAALQFKVALTAGNCFRTADPQPRNLCAGLQNPYEAHSTLPISGLCPRQHLRQQRHLFRKALAQRAYFWFKFPACRSVLSIYYARGLQILCRTVARASLSHSSRNAVFLRQFAAKLQVNDGI